MQYTITFIVLLICGFSSFAQKTLNNYAIQSIPSELRENAHTVMRLESQEFEVLSPTKAIERNHYIVSVLNIKSKMDHISIFYDSFNKIKKAYCSIYDEFGNEVKRYSKKELSDQSAGNYFSLYTDHRVRYLDLSHLSPPFTVEYYYEITHEQGFQAYPIWHQNHEVAVEKAQITCILPPSQSVKHKTFNIELEKKAQNIKGKKAYTWNIQNLPAKEREPLSPPMHEVLPMLVVTPENFQIDHYQGSYESWEKLGAFVHTINSNRDELSPQMTQKVLELTQECTSDTEKIAVLYKYLQENTRYVNVSIGIGGWQTYDAQYVESNKYGDCKALSNFMKSMLKVAGISSNLVLINLRKDRPIQEDFPLAWFNHMILYVPSEEIWLECTSQGYPPNYIGSGNADQNVLVVDEKKSQLVHIPAIEQNKIAHFVHIQLDETGTAIMQDSVFASGIQHEQLRNYKTYFSSKKEIIESFRERSNLPSFDIKKFEIKVSNSKPEANHILELEIPKYGSKAGKRIFVPLNRLSAFNNLLPENDNRQYSIVQKQEYQDELHLKLDLPLDFSIESIPQNTTLQTPYGVYEISVEVEENQIYFQRNLTIHAFEVPASEYEDVRTFYKEISKLDNAQFVLKKKET